VALLFETEAAISDLSANWQRMLGAHGNYDPAVAVPGMIIGEAPFNPAKHLPSAINPFSLMEQVAGVQHVRQVIPRNPLDVSIVVHNDPAQRDDPEWMTRAKLQLASTFKDIFTEVLPVSDRVHTYVIGDRTSELAEHEIEYLDNTLDPNATARTVAEICQDGLAVVLSTFKNLPLDGVKNANYDSAVAVKTNHLFEVELQPGAGKWKTGDVRNPIVNAGKPKELAVWNDTLRQRHAALKARLGQAGLAVAQVIFDPRHRPYGFDLARTDHSVAEALRSIAQ
jgi:hypothetical protein